MVINGNNLVVDGTTLDATELKTLDSQTVQTIAGIKTFTSSPVVPTPTTDMEVANKKYVDDNAEATWVANDSRAKTALNALGTAPIYACRAWVNFNGTGTVAIRASGNVSSITDNGTGNYTVNFTTAMPDANYAWSGSARCPSANGTGIQEYITDSQTSSSLTVRVLQNASSLTQASDGDIVRVSVFR